MVAQESVVPSREDQVALVETYFDCFVRNEFDAIPIAPDYTGRTPFARELSGEAAVNYFKLAASHVTSIRIRQHIVEGNRVATLLEEETADGQLEVMAMFEIRDGLIKNVVVSYDSRHVGASRPPPAGR